MNKLRKYITHQGDNAITIKNGEWTRPTAKPQLSSRPLPAPRDRKQ